MLAHILRVLFTVAIFAAATEATARPAPEIQGQNHLLPAAPGDAARLTRDARYRALASLVSDAGYALHPARASTRAAQAGTTLLVPVLDRAGADRGFLSVSKERWVLTLSREGGARVYEAVRQPDRSVQVIARTGDTAAEGEVPSAPQASALAASSSMTGSNYCIYVKEVRNSYACVGDDNPFGYYFVTYYRQGDRITSTWQAWYADWRGRAILCPRNNTLTKWVQCGYPPR